MASSITASSPAINGRTGKKNLADSQREAIYHSLHLHSVNGKLKRGLVRDVAAAFSVCERTVMRIWKQAMAQLSQGMIPNVASRMAKVVGRKRVDLDLTAVAAIPLRCRCNIRSISKELGIPKSTMHNRIKEGALRRHSNAIKPALTEANKTARLQFCLSFLTRSESTSTLMFNAMYNIIHIDEKWFYLTKQSKRYYLVSGEDEPIRSCKSKKFITKVMFLAAVARPRFCPLAGDEVFSGKIGIFPLTTQEPAKRSSKNRVAGTLETKPILSVTKEVTRRWLIERLLPAIKAKWPQASTGPIYIQQDNAKPHLSVNDPEFVAAAAETGLDIHLFCQPPNSPDLNVLDLGFFRAIQSIQEQQRLRTIDDLVNAVETAFEKMAAVDLNSVFLTLQTCMVEILKNRGGNNYRVPHIGKDRLNRAGQLPQQIECDEQLIGEMVSYLDHESSSGLV